MKSRYFVNMFATYVLIIIVTVLVVSLVVGRQVRAVLEQKVEEELLTYARLIDAGTEKELESGIKRLAGISGSRVTIIDPSGKVLADSVVDATTVENHLNRTEVQEARVRGSGRSVRVSRSTGVETMYVAVLSKTAEPGGYIRFARPFKEVGDSIHALNMSLLTSILILSVISVVLAFFFAYRFSKPINQMEEFTEKLRDGKTTGSLYLKEGGEMQQLASNINYLVRELQIQINAANEEKSKVLAAFASMSEGLLVLDEGNRIETFNRAFRDMIGSRFGEVKGKTLLEAFRSAELHDFYESFIAEGTPISKVISVREPVPRVYEITISAIEGLPHDDRKTMLVFHDITRIKKLEKMRADFVANVTHELKTPLTAILGFIETLQAGAIEDRETARKFLDVIDRQAARLNRLIDDLLVISNIELGEMKFHFEGVSLGEPISTALSMIEQKAGEKGIAIKKEVPGDLPLVRADRDRLVQIFLNILDNAVKFNNPGGEVSVAAAVRDGGVEVRISDTGTGIPQSEISRLGERFYRVDKGRSREMGGTGLGLSIVKHLMIAHEGRMDIESRLGQGTAVTLCFPLFREDAAV
jgi:two-component system phosphate regulon sensor histidine kinase PhoR